MEMQIRSGFWNLFQERITVTEFRTAASGSYLTATNTPAYGTGFELSVADRAADNNQLWVLDETDTCIVQSEMENGSIEPQAANVTKGDSLEVTATPAEGYEIASVAVNGSVLSEDSYKISETGVLTFTLSDITENQYVTVIAREPEVPVLTATAGYRTEETGIPDRRNSGSGGL